MYAGWRYSGQDPFLTYNRLTPDGYSVDATEIDRWMESPVRRTRSSTNVLLAFSIAAQFDRETERTRSMVDVEGGA